MVLGTLTEGCGSTHGQYTFWHVSRFDFDRGNNSIHATVEKELSIAEAMPEVELNWGTYHPKKRVLARSALSSPDKSGSGSSTGSGCGAPACATIDGFPAATCGAITFDTDLDQAIGYLDFDSKDFSNSLKAFAPDLTDDSASDNNDFGPVETAPPMKVRRGLGSFFSSVAQVC